MVGKRKSKMRARASFAAEKLAGVRVSVAKFMVQLHLQGTAARK
jgi:hypothetical protein